MVTLELASGKSIDLPLERLIPEDRKAILSHFKIEPPKEGDPIRSDAKPLEHEALGKVSAPIESAPNSHYLLYLPKSLKEGRPAPLLHFNDSGGVDPGRMQIYTAACDRFGWILAGSVESKNGNSFEKNHEFAKANIEHLKQNPLVDAKRVYFTGGSGGGAMSWWNFSKLDATGTLPIIAYLEKSLKISKGHHFVIGGATDYNRYLSAHSASHFGKDAVYRPYPGAHARPADNGIIQEGIAWLTAKYLRRQSKDAALNGDRLDYEAAMIDWINELSKTEPHRAYYLCTLLQETYGISGENAAIIAQASSKLGSSPANLKYAAGITALNDFGTKVLTDSQPNGSSYGVSYPDQTRKAEKLAAEYKGTPYVAETFLELALPTVKQ